MTLVQPKIGLVLLTQMLAWGVRVGSPILSSDLPNNGLVNLYLVTFGHESLNTTFSDASATLIANPLPIQKLKFVLVTSSPTIFENRERDPFY